MTVSQLAPLIPFVGRSFEAHARKRGIQVTSVSENMILIEKSFYTPQLGQRLYAGEFKPVDGKFRLIIPIVGSWRFLNNPESHHHVVYDFEAEIMRFHAFRQTLVKR